MNKQEIIKQVQAGNVNAGQGENIFVGMTPEQYKARKDSFISQIKQNWHKLGANARIRIANGVWQSAI